MKLTLDQIQQITTGAVSVTQDSVGFHFSRFTQAQKEAFRNLNEAFYPRACSSTGICLSFHTDAQNILIHSVTGGQYEVLVDENPMYFFHDENGPLHMAITLPEGDKHVKLLFSRHSEAVISNIIVDEHAYIRPHTYDRKILFLGDSIVQGVSSDRDSQSFAWRVSSFFNANALNLGVGGSRMDSRTLEDVGFDPDVIIIGYGTNDYGVCPSPESQDTACKEYFSRVKELYPDKKIFYISPIWRADHALVRASGTLDDCRERLIRRCQEAGFIHIDGYRMHPHCTDYYGDGFLHPNSQGFAFYSLNLIRELLRYI